jgi:hypothetical protein
MALEWYGLVHLHDFYNNLSSPSGVAKHDVRCMHFADSASKFAGGAQFVQRIADFVLLISYLKLLLVRTLVQNELILLEITF